MAKVYRTTRAVRIFNQIGRMLIPLGVMPSAMHLLQVKGRKTGKVYTTPVSIVTHEGKRYLVSPYGQTNWVRNARAAGEVSLKRGRKEETLHLKELHAAEAAPILKQYISKEAITRPYFDVKPDSELIEFEAEAPFHPVFELQ